MAHQHPLRPQPQQPLRHRRTQRRRRTHRKEDHRRHLRRLGRTRRRRLLGKRPHQSRSLRSIRSPLDRQEPCRQQVLQESHGPSRLQHRYRPTPQYPRRQLQHRRIRYSYHYPGYTDEDLQGIIERNFDLRPGLIIKNFDLRRPIYKKTASGGHFGRGDFEWEAIKDLSHEKKQ